MTTKTHMVRNVIEGDSIVFDKGRIKVTVLQRTGRMARLAIEMNADVVLESTPKKTTLVLPAARIRHRP